ncbi:MAG: hypothetical protein ACI9R3_006128 [Verrucomicrobiales bacterium]|jgi:hypothetical protein
MITTRIPIVSLILVVGLIPIGCDQSPRQDGAAPVKSTPAQSTSTSVANEPELFQQRLLQGTVEVPFAQLIQQVSGNQVLPVDLDDPVTDELLNVLAEAADVAISQMNAPDSPVKKLRRINEASRLFEDALMEAIDSTEGFAAQTPPTAAGKLQRSGYPDIKIQHLSSRRVFYLDPKLYEESSESSSLRSFYFTPKRATNKVLEDACHLLLGIAHDGNDGDWRFTGWKLIDLASLDVRLKSEFQASNKDLYRPEATILSKKIVSEVENQ